MNVFLRRCDVLKIACLAQILNVIAPILTPSTGLLQQSILFPFQLVRRFASGQSPDVLVQAPTYTSHPYGDLPLRDVSASYFAETGQQAVFLVSRSQDGLLPVEICWQGAAPSRVSAIHRLSGSDPKAANTFVQPDTVVAQQLPGQVFSEGRMALELPPLSLTVITAGGQV